MFAKPPGKPPGERPRWGWAVEPDRGALPQARKDQRIALFLSGFDQQDKQHFQGMKKELDLLLRTAAKAFAVELLRMPAAIRKRKALFDLQTQVVGFIGLWFKW